jgi:hypothetical protein
MSSQSSTLGPCTNKRPVPYDWELICDSRKEEGDGSKSMLERRMREEVVDDPSGPVQLVAPKNETRDNTHLVFVFVVSPFVGSKQST